MKVYLDDERPTPEGWHRVYTANEAITLLRAGVVEDISLDHDLGDDQKFGTGYDVASFIEEQAFLGEMNRVRWFIHSANPVGRANMKAALERADDFWRKGGCDAPDSNEE